MKNFDPGRRRFIGTAAQSGMGFLLLPMAGCKVTDTPVPGSFLSLEQRQATQVLADQIIPPGNGESGAGQLGALDYIENLLTAFDHDPPRIYATTTTGGDFVPLNRYQEAAWRLTLFGGTAPSGAKITGLRDLIPQGLNKAISLAPINLAHLPATGVNLVLSMLDRGFWQSFSSLVIESTFAAPVYGGNQGMGGWKISRFEGEIVGFTTYNAATGSYVERADFPVSTPDPGLPTDPLSALTLLELDAISIFTGGRVYRMRSDSDTPPPIPPASN